MIVVSIAIRRSFHSGKSTQGYFDNILVSYRYTCGPDMDLEHSNCRGIELVLYHLEPAVNLFSFLRSPITALHKCCVEVVQTHSTLTPPRAYLARNPSVRTFYQIQ